MRKLVATLMPIADLGLQYSVCDADTGILFIHCKIQVVATQDALTVDLNGTGYYLARIAQAVSWMLPGKEFLLSLPEHHMEGEFYS